MAYQKQTWINLPDRTTPISADRLNHMEDGIEAIDTELENIDTHLTDYVKNTDYATSQKAGVVKVNSFGIQIGSSGLLYANNMNYSTYSAQDDRTFIGKGTLENVITGKELVNKTYVDDLVGDIETILTTLDVGSGVNGN